MPATSLTLGPPDIPLPPMYIHDGPEWMAAAQLVDMLQAANIPADSALWLPISVGDVSPAPWKVSGTSDALQVFRILAM